MPRAAHLPRNQKSPPKPSFPAQKPGFPIPAPRFFDAAARDRAGNRALFFDDYCALVTLYLMNPLIGSMRALQHVAALPNVARKLGVRRFSLGSFSEAPAAFEPARLLAV